MSELDVVKVWEDLHAMPELGFEEVKTSAYLAKALEEMGYEVTTGLAGTGVLGVMRGSEPGPVLMLRADMDALPFKNDDGSIARVHACGHDGHCAMLLCAAQKLVGKVRKGTLKILFQPGEETLHGASEIIKTGVVDDVDIALGMHVRPIQDIPVGTVCAAVRHTSSCFLQVKIKGRTSHASRPHLGVNCAEAAVVIANAINSIKVNPNLAWSCKVTSIQASAAAVNIIPEEATMMLDIRAQTNEMMDELLAKVKAAAEYGAMSVGATASIHTPNGVCPAAVFDEDLVDEVREVIGQELGQDKIAKDCGGGGEDFHFFKRLKPELHAAYFGVGAGCTPGLHARNMTFDVNQLANGVKVLTAVALRKIG